MKASELIEILKQRIKDNGDLECKVYSEVGGGACDVDILSVVKEKNPMCWNEVTKQWEKATYPYFVISEEEEG